MPDNYRMCQIPKPTIKYVVMLSEKIWDVEQNNSITLVYKIQKI